MAEQADPHDPLPRRRFFSRRRSLSTALVVLGAMAAAAAFGPTISPYAYDQQTLTLLGEPAPPCASHWLGTDELGRDVLTRVLAGGRISLAVGLSCALIATLFGALVGSASGFFGGWIDQALMRFTDVALSIPALPLVLVLSGMLRPSPALLVLVIAGLIWMAPARLIRAQVLSLRRADFVSAARCLGAGHPRVIARHILPNILGSITVSATLAAGGSIMLESALSFLGFGVQPPVPTWGGLLNSASPWLATAPWLALPPGICIFLTVACINFFGEGVRDAAGRTG